MTALAAAESLARGFRAANPNAICDLAPIADGGEGFAAALGAALQAEWIEVDTLDPINRPIKARYAWIASKATAIMEMSEASGLWRLKPEERAPLKANTRGTGLLLDDAIQRGAKKVIIGLGGSATTDGGTGLAHALGFRFINQEGRIFEPLPGNLHTLAAIETPAHLSLPEIVAACDVTNPLLGERGTAHVFGPQKGADAETVNTLDHAMRCLADVVHSNSGNDFRNVVSAGAAGGLGFGLLAFCNARIEGGFEVVANILELERRIAEADMVVTGEGRLDHQTLDGKGPAGVAAMARAAGKRVIAFGGSVDETVKQSGIFNEVIPIMDRNISVEEAMRNGASLLEKAAAQFHLE